MEKNLGEVHALGERILGHGHGSLVKAKLSLNGGSGKPTEEALFLVCALGELIPTGAIGTGLSRRLSLTRDGLVRVLDSNFLTLD
jgi:hypothetical protein